MFAKNDKSAQIISELEEKIAKQAEAISGYRNQLMKLSDHKSERDLFSELTAILTVKESTVDDLLKKSAEALSQHIKAGYVGLFLLDDKKELFEYRFGKGYNASAFPEIPVIGSIMGKSLFRREMIWEASIEKRFDVISLNQDPVEHNVLCVPLILLGTDYGVLRCGNIDPLVLDKTKTMLRTVTQLLCSTLERQMLQTKNEWTMRSLDISFSIARLLEDTLDMREIFMRVCMEIPRLFGCKGCVLAVKNENGALEPAACWPENFELAGTRSSAIIYLRNLLAAFPEGSARIADIHRDDRKWAWNDLKIKSLCMAPIRLRNEVRGVLVAIGPTNEPYEHAHENLLGIVAAQASVTLERARYFQKQEDQARCDGLTGLLNRRMFNESIVNELARVKRYGHQLSLVMMDIDHFKKCNDTYGHPVGDLVIKMVAKTIAGMIRTTDRAFRYGGEEFVILLPETQANNGATLAERIRQRIESDRSVNSLSITVSLGITGLLPADSIESFVKRADAALYHAKESGRNRVIIS